MTPLAVPGNPANTDPTVYKAWADADAAARQGSPGIPGAAAGPYGPNGAPGAATASTAEEKREAARKRQQERLRASSIAFDFTKAVQPGQVRPAAAGTGSDNGAAAVGTAAEQSMAFGVAPANLQPPNLQQLSQPSSRPAATPEGKEQSEPHTLKLHTCTDLCEGDLIETVLTNRINGEYPGFIDAMVTQPVYSHSWDPRGRRLLIPIGSRVLGNVTAVNSTTAQRLFVAFHKLRRPDGSTFSLDNFTGLDMQGEAGLRDLVNHHLFSIFGASLAIAAIGGVAQIGNNQTGFGYDPSVAIRNSASSELGQESMQILNHFLNQPPTMLVREGKNLVKVYISQDLTLAPYESKEIS
jgi:type IV secretion system protein VirB10